MFLSSSAYARIFFSFFWIKSVLANWSLALIIWTISFKAFEKYLMYSTKRPNMNYFYCWMSIILSLRKMLVRPILLFGVWETTFNFKFMLFISFSSSRDSINFYNFFFLFYLVISSSSLTSKFSPYVSF